MPQRRSTGAVSDMLVYAGFPPNKQFKQELPVGCDEDCPALRVELEGVRSSQRISDAEVRQLVRQ